MIISICYLKAYRQKNIDFHIREPTKCLMEFLNMVDI